MKKIQLFALIFLLSALGCEPPKDTTDTPTEGRLPDVSAQAPTNVPFTWDNANIYFLLTDRFNNGSTENDVNFGRDGETGVLRGFMGGDLKGITQKIEEGYFTKLGISAIWFTPIVEQIHEGVDEGTGATYGFHGYWTKDWTTLDPNFGTFEDLSELVEKAHANGIRIILDVVVNHTGPVTEKDPVWENWVRTEPQCTYQDYETTVSCTLVKNLPDVLTNSDEEVGIPPHLEAKWKEEGRYEQEIAELDAFFERTGYPRAPRFYIIKWLTDYIREFGVDGFRVDTVKHTEESVWGELWKEALAAFQQWKTENPDKVMDDNEFYMMGEVYGYGISGGRMYDFGDKNVDYFAEGFKSLINFEFKYDANEKSYEEIYTKYDSLLRTKLPEHNVVNYLSSHDDGSPFDAQRTKPFEAANKLLLAQGAAQVYYGDESSRSLIVEGTEGDATLRSFMNWEEIEENATRGNQEIIDVLIHWQKLGQFRKAHPAIGAGAHEMLSEKPYVFKRIYQQGDWLDKVVVGLDMPEGEKNLPVTGVFAEGTELTDAYSGKRATVTNGTVTLDTRHSVVLLHQDL